MQRPTTAGLYSNSQRSLTKCSMMVSYSYQPRSTSLDWELIWPALRWLDNVALSFSARSSTDRMPDDLYFAFLAYMNRRNPLQPYHSEIALPADPLSRLVVNFATMFDHVIVAGHRYHAARRAPTAVNSAVLIRVSPAGATWVGELQDIVLYENVGLGLRELFGYVRWYRPIHDLKLDDTTWKSW